MEDITPFFWKGESLLYPPPLTETMVEPAKTKTCALIKAMFLSKGLQGKRMPEWQKMGEPKVWVILWKRGRGRWG